MHACRTQGRTRKLGARPHPPFPTVPKKIFVGSLAYATTDASLRDCFDRDEHRVVSARVIVDRETGRSRGFGFVEFEGDADVSAIVRAFDQTSLDGRRIAVKEAEERGRGPRRGPPGGGGARGRSAPRVEFRDERGRTSERPTPSSEVRRPREPQGHQHHRDHGDHRGPRDVREPRERDWSRGAPPRRDAPRDFPPPDAGRERPRRKRKEKDRYRDDSRGGRGGRRGGYDDEKRAKNKWRGGRGWDYDEDE